MRDVCEVVDREKAFEEEFIDAPRSFLGCNQTPPEAGIRRHSTDASACSFNYSRRLIVK